MALTRLGTNAITSVPSSAITALPAGVGGKVLQVVSTTKTDTFVYTGVGLVDVTGLSLSITPSATSSKIYLIANVNISADARYHAFIFVRNGTTIGVGDTDGVRTSVAVSSTSNNGETSNSAIMRNSSASFLDAPNTVSAITYKIQAGNTFASQTTYINRIEASTDATWSHRGISTITAYEIAG